MACERIPYNGNNVQIVGHRCQKRKGHKGMCQATYILSWYGYDKNEVKSNNTKTN